ncbi:hypothetical protein BH10ACI1_BH10ACI1_19410 [soil metagenome]
MKFEIKQILFSFIFLALSCLSVAAQTQKIPQEIPTVAYCDLVLEPALYDNKVVRVKANYFVAFEGSIMSDSACDGKQTWVKFDNDIEKSTPRKIWKKFDHWTDASAVRNKRGGIDYPSREVIVMWVGLFQGVKATQTIGKLTLSLGFGHMNGFDFQFTAQKVEAVSKVASD